MSGLEGGNFDLRAAEARRNQAYASLGVDRSFLSPQVLSESSVVRERQPNRGGTGDDTGSYFTTYGVALSLNYEVDLWGRVRRLIEAGRANADAAEASVDQVRLSLQTQLARSYFAMRFLDSEAEVLTEAIQTRQETLQLARDRFEGGKTSEADVARAESELASTRAEIVRLQAPRAALENAIAVLTGRNAANFLIAPASITRASPNLSAGSPASLLGRRPDVFAAERSLAATSARIGVATASFYPRISLLGSGGFSSVSSSDFLKWSSREFAVGPQVDLPLFDGFRRKADLALAVASHEEALAVYQQSVLTAYSDVENALASRRGALNEISALEQSVAANSKSLFLADNRYKEGITSYIEVVDSQRELLNAQRARVQAQGRSYAATVQLIQALGGGFSR